MAIECDSDIKTDIWIEQTLSLQPPPLSPPECGIELKASEASDMLGKCLVTELYSQP